MGKIFWIVCGVVLALGVGIWAGGFFGPGTEAAAEARKARVDKDELERTARNKKKIKTDKHIAEQKSYGERLAAEQKALLGKMAERDAKVNDKTFAPPPPSPAKGLADFREWLQQQYMKRDEIFKKAGIERKGGSSVGDVTKFGNWKDEDRPLVLKNLAISIQVFKALAAARSGVKYVLPLREGGKAVVREETVLRLDSLSFERDVAGGRRAAGRGRPAARAAAAGTPLVRAYGFGLSFVAHYNVALDVVRQLESSKQGLFIVRKLHAVRFEEQLPRPGLASEEDLAKLERYGNRSGHEAPVVVHLSAALTEFPMARGTE